MSARTFAAFGLLGAMLVGAAVMGAAGPARPEPCATCRAELRSWVVVDFPVLGRARHLYLQIECPNGYEHLNGRVEFTEAALRRDYAPPRDPAKGNRVARMSRGDALRPLYGRLDNRLEDVFTIPARMAECLQQDRVFESPYRLLGTNSSSGLRKVMEGCGCGVPRRVLERGGLLGEFPGIDFDVGPEVPPEKWPEYGVGCE